MQLSSFSFVHNLWGGPEGICRALVLHILANQLADLCRSIAACTSKSLWILPLSLSSLLSSSQFAGFSVGIQSGKLFPLLPFSVMVPVSRRISRGSSHFQGCHIYLIFASHNPLGNQFASSSICNESKRWWSVHSQHNLSYKMYYMYTFSLVIPKNLYFWKTQQELPIISCKQKQ